jgi:multidrug efflux pump
LLTTTTTILGLLPMAFELNVDFANGVISRGSSTSDWWVLLSSAVVYGLAFSTVLTLVLTPVLLAAPTVIGRRIEALGGKPEQEKTPRAETELPRAAE